MISPALPEHSSAGGFAYIPEVFDIAITGIGIVTPLGLGCSQNLDRLLAGESGVKPEVLPGLETRGAILSGTCPQFELADRLRFPKSLKYMSRAVQLAMRAALEAFETSGLQHDRIDPYRLAIYTGAGQTGLDYKEFSRALEVAWGSDHEPDFRHLGGIPTRMIDPYFSLRTLANGGIGLLSAEFGARGPSNNFVDNDIASALALQAACWDLTEGRCDAAIVGGFDSLLYPTALFALSEAGSLAGDTGHFGRIIPGEGAAFLVIERHADAVERGACVLGKLLGSECSVEPLLQAAGDSGQSGIRRLVHRLPEACRSFEFAVSPGGALQGSVAGALGQDLPVSSLTRLTGYLGAATATVELALGLLAARQGSVPVGTVREETGHEGPATLEQIVTPIETQDPTGIFISASWGGQIAAIVARANSINERHPARAHAD